MAVLVHAVLTPRLLCYETSEEELERDGHDEPGAADQRVVAGLESKVGEKEEENGAGDAGERQGKPLPEERHEAFLAEGAVQDGDGDEGGPDGEGF